jgi:hypothetical protein
MGVFSVLAAAALAAPITISSDRHAQDYNPFPRKPLPKVAKPDRGQRRRYAEYDAHVHTRGVYLYNQEVERQQRIKREQDAVFVNAAIEKRQRKQAKRIANANSLL